MASTPPSRGDALAIPAATPPPPASAPPATTTTTSSFVSAAAAAAAPPSPSASSASGTAVKWADQVGKSAAKTTEHVAAGATKMVGWTLDNAELKTATGARGLRPMHVRVSVRVHHVAFLHPGLDNGGRSTIGDRRNGKWFKKNKQHKQKSAATATTGGGGGGTPPGLLNFGSKKGSWKNPISPKNAAAASSKRHHSSSFGAKDDGGSGHGVSPVAKARKESESEDANEASEIAEIVSAEAFRLSRDGIIQHHYALNRAAPQEQQRREQQPSSSQTAASNGTKGPRGSKPFSSAPGMHPASKRRLASDSNSIQYNPQYPSMLSPRSAADPEEARRYYKECAARPKGYRRLVVSSAVPTHDVAIPPPPPQKVVPTLYGGSARSNVGFDSGGSKRLSRKLGGKIGDGGGGGGGGGKSDNNKQPGPTCSWAFEKDINRAFEAANNEDEKKKNGAGKKDGAGPAKNENLFDNVEYQYIGPPLTGPDFFQLLRTHGAATFGRYLPELACSVPNHSVGFEIGKPKVKKRFASTQPLVVEAPHVIWGDARDKMLSRIATEGCPLIDSRKFEYVSNVALDETEMSESLMVCGATLWVQNSDEDDASLSSASNMKPHYTKGMVKAEYYGGKFVDGVKGGLSVGVQGLTKGTKGTIHATKDAAHIIGRGTKDAARVIGKGTKKLVPIPHDRELDTVAATEAITEATTEAPTEERKERKRDKLKSMFNPKKLKVKNKLRRRAKNSRGSSEDGRSVDGSIASEIDDDHSSVGGESVATDSSFVGDILSAHSMDALAGQASNVDLDTNTGQVVDDTDTPREEVEEEFMVVKPVPYVLLLDDIIDIRIVSFPDKNDVIAHFPISVASVMIQRSMEDRIDDPLKPSELTATLIQEPSARELRWGVELKVTLRAVEVKPHVPRVIPRPKDMIDAEMAKMKERLQLLGKKPEDIKKDLKAKEDEVVKEENDLNEAIVAYGYGKGENDGAGQSEVRLRQMFYCEREHGAIARKVKRRALLTEDETVMMNDARIDPSSLKMGYEKEEKQKLMELLDLNFPGIEKEDASAIGNSLPVGGTSMTSGAAVSAVSASVNDTLARVSLLMAHSLDTCLAGHTVKPTVPEVEHRLRQTVTEGIRPQVTKEVAKEWCSSVAEKLSTHVSNVSATDATVKSSITKLQSIIAESTMGPGMSVDESAFDTKEEMKLDEDELAESQVKGLDSQSGDLDSSELVDWITSVASQLESYAEELDGDQVSIAYSDTLSTIAPSEEEKSVSSSSIIVPVDTGEDPPVLDGGRRRRIQELEMELRDPGASSISESQKSADDPDEDMWDKIMAQQGAQKARPLSNSSLRFRSATSISTVKNALPRSITVPKNQIEPLLKIMKKSHGHSHQVNMRTSSLSATLVYLSVILTAFALGAYSVYVMSHGVWSMIGDMK